jgi:acetoin utilization protein AcuB
MLAVDVMTPNPRTVRVDDSVESAIEALQVMEVRHLPVVDEDGELVGMVSDRDLSPYSPGASEGDMGEDAVVARARRRVAEVMQGDVISVDTEAELTDVIDQILDQKIGAVPVVDGEGHPVGIVSYIDILRVVAPATTDLEPPPKSAREETP